MKPRLLSRGRSLSKISCVIKSIFCILIAINGGGVMKQLLITCAFLCCIVTWIHAEKCVCIKNTSCHMNDSGQIACRASADQKRDGRAYCCSKNAYDNKLAEPNPPENKKWYCCSDLASSPHHALTNDDLKGLFGQ